MHPDAMMEYLKTGIYSFKYDDEIKHTKREKAKERKALREARSEELQKQGKSKSKKSQMDKRLRGI